VLAAAREVTAAMRPMKVARRFLLIVECIFFMAPLVLLVLRGFFNGLNPIGMRLLCKTQ
jgi:hypothetical protein